MSILVENEFGCVLSHEKALNEIYSQVICATDSSVTSLQVKPDLFNIISPFKMDSQIKDEPPADIVVSDGEEGAFKLKNRKRKRKRKEPLNIGEMNALQFHEQVKDLLQTALNSLVCLAKKKGHLKLDAVPNQVDNNKLSRVAAAISGPSISLADLCGEKGADNSKVRVFGQESVPSDSPVGAVWQFTEERATIVKILSESYALPPRCTFRLSDLSVLQQSYHNLGKYDLIVIDPPWQNKSAKRLKKYWTMKNEDLLHLPVSDLADNCCLIVVWATNKQSQHHFIQNTLFPAWNVQFLAHWLWLKVTKTGEPVYKMDSPHKKPYESVIIGCHCKTPASCQHKSIHKEKVLVSVPCSLHSKKPPLFDCLKTYLPSEPRCLELFARNLWPSWTSWGNEVLLHQHIDFFEPVT